MPSSGTHNFFFVPYLWQDTKQNLSFSLFPCQTLCPSPNYRGVHSLFEQRLLELHICNTTKPGQKHFKISTKIWFPSSLKFNLKRKWWHFNFRNKSSLKDVNINHPIFLNTTWCYKFIIVLSFTIFTTFYVSRINKDYYYYKTTTTSSII